MVNGLFALLTSISSSHAFSWRLILKIPCLLASSGRPTYILRSMRPGLVRAGSRRSGRLVAPTTTTLSFLTSVLLPPTPDEGDATPSSSVRSWLSNLSPLPPPPVRVDAIESISSKKITQGLAIRALRNNDANALSLSPSHLLSSSGPLTARKFIFPSVARARAIKVLEHPGGPYKRTPRGG